MNEDKSENDGEQKRKKSPWSYLGLGIQFAVTVCLFSGLGYWLDSRFGWSPWGVVFFSTFGVAAGMYHFLKEAV